MVNTMTKYDEFKSRAKTYQTVLTRLTRDTEHNSIRLDCGSINLDNKCIHVVYSYIPIGLPDEILKAYIHADKLLRGFLQEIVNINNEKLLAIDTLLSEGEPDA